MFKYFIMISYIVLQTMVSSVIADTSISTDSQNVSKIYNGEIRISDTNKVPFTAQLNFSDENRVTGEFHLVNATRKILKSSKLSEHNVLLTLSKPQQLSILFSSDFSQFSGFDNHNALWTATFVKNKSATSTAACKKSAKSTSASLITPSYNLTNCDYYEKLGLYNSFCASKEGGSQKMDCLKVCNKAYSGCQTGCFTSRMSCDNCAKEHERCKKTCE